MMAMRVREQARVQLWEPKLVAAREGEGELLELLGLRPKLRGSGKALSREGMKP